MQIQVNGESKTLDRATTIAWLVQEMTGSPEQRGVAVARNGDVVPRTEWSTDVEDGDEIEIVRAVQGG
jgi:sulfur carrier protein